MIDYHIKGYNKQHNGMIKLPSYIVWSINKPINEINMINKHMKKVAILKNDSNNVVRYLVLPMHRFSLNYHTILLENKEYLLEDILTIIYQFYNEKKLTYIELKSLNSCDVYDYINGLCLELKLDPNKNVYPIDIMGEKVIFDKIYIDLDNCGDIQYMLYLN
jgi:hypothetical protein